MIAYQYKNLIERVDGLILRERVMILIAGVVFVFFVTDSLAFQPIYKKQNVLLQEIQDQEIQLELLRIRSTQLSDDYLLEEPSPLIQLHQELNEFEEKLEFRLDSMLSPEMAASILEQIIIEEKGLALHSVNTRQTPLISRHEDSGDSLEIEDIYRYELELELQGGYLDTLSYLRALESLPWKFFFE